VDIRKMMQVMNTVRQETSAQHGQATLGSLIERLSKMPQSARIVVDDKDVGISPHSYRGYYSDLSIGTFSDTPTTVEEAVNILKKAVGKTYTGYKGGDFEMNQDTLLWFADYSDCGPAVVGVRQLDTDKVELLIRELDE
jgi:hypothetical protein